MKKFSNKYQQTSDSPEEFDEALKKLTNELSYGPVTPPQLEVPISIKVAHNLAEASIRYLEANQVEVRATDIVTLERATIVQCRIKAALARGESVFATTDDFIYVQKIRAYRNSLTDVIKSHKFLIDQIGIASYGKQEFVPLIAITPDVIIAPDGYVRTDITKQDKRLYVEAAYAKEDPLNVRDVHQLWINEALLLPNVNFTEEYMNLIMRVRVKCPWLIETIDWTDVSGSLSQTVGSKIKDFYEARVECWSRNVLDATVLLVGGGLRFGRDSQAVIHNENEIAGCAFEFASEAFLEKLVDILHRQS